MLFLCIASGELSSEASIYSYASPLGSQAWRPLFSCISSGELSSKVFFSSRETFDFLSIMGPADRVLKRFLECSTAAEIDLLDPSSAKQKWHFHSSFVFFFYNSFTKYFACNDLCRKLPLRCSGFYPFPYKKRILALKSCF